MQNVVQSESRNRPDVFIDHADFLQDQEEGKSDFEVFMNGQSKRLQVLTVGVGRLISDMKLIETILLILVKFSLHLKSYIYRQILISSNSKFLTSFLSTESKLSPIFSTYQVDFNISSNKTYSKRLKT